MGDNLVIVICVAVAVVLSFGAGFAVDRARQPSLKVLPEISGLSGDRYNCFVSER